MFDLLGNDVSDLYYLIRTYGDANIQPLDISIKAGDATKAYDGTPLTSSEYELIGGALLDGHRIETCMFRGSQTEIGRSDNIITSVLIVDANGENVTSNYAIELLVGRLKVVSQ